MQRLLSQLTESGVVDPATAEWACSRHLELGGPLDTILLELDIVDEGALLRALSTRFEHPVASFDELESIESDIAERLNLGLARSFEMCPLYGIGGAVVAWVDSPLSTDSAEELRHLFGLDVIEMVAPAHYIALARERVYGAELEERDRELNARLSRRRGAPSFEQTLAAIGQASDIAEGAGALSNFAADRLETSCFFVEEGDGLRVANKRGPGAPEGTLIALSEIAGTLAPALRYGGFFLGPVHDSAANRAFFDALSRPLPEWAFIVPLPSRGGPSVVFLAENGPRAFPTRWVAEISLATARLGSLGGELLAAGDAPDADREELSAPDAVEAALVLESAPEHTETCDAGDAEEMPSKEEGMGARSAEATPPSGVVSDDELAVLKRLRSSAARAERNLSSYVDELLSAHASRPLDAPRSTPALAGEVKELFERLAVDIPTQFARGMEAALRDLAPRMGSSQPPSGAVAAPPPPARTSAAASVDLVVKKSTGPREVPSYRSRRSKTKRRKL